MSRTPTSPLATRTGRRNTPVPRVARRLGRLGLGLAAAVAPAPAAAAAAAGCWCCSLSLFHKHTNTHLGHLVVSFDGQCGRVCSVFACRDSPPSPVGRVGPVGAVGPVGPVGAVGAVRAVRGFSRFLESPQSTATPPEVPWWVWVGSWRFSVRGSCTFV